MISLVSVAQSSWQYELSPVDGDCSVSSEGTFTITFTGKDKVYPVKGGKISLNAADGMQLYPIQFSWDGTALPPEPWVFESSISEGTVTFSGNQVIINFNTALSELSHYYITVHPEAIRDAQMTQFPGLVGNAPGSGALTCDDDMLYGWDFTVEDITLPKKPTLDPAFGEVNVEVDADMIMTFNVNMAWAEAYADGVADLQPGDIALYTSTDDPFGQYGGDVIFTKPSAVSISNKKITIGWPGDMPATTTVYVRIKSGIFKKFQACPDCNDEFLWGGFNNGEWQFTTKDAEAPGVTIAATDVCDAPKVGKSTNFTITIDEEVIYTNNMVPFNALEVNDNVGSYVTFTGGSFTAKVSSVSAAGVVITVDPASNLASGQTYTVALKGGMLWDESLNPVGAKTKDFTAGDFLAPTFTKLESVSEDGTTFQILANSTETETPVTVYYIVVEKDDVWVDGEYEYAPTKLQLVGLANYWDVNPTEGGNPNLPRLDPFQDINWPLANYTYDVTGGADVVVNVWAAGKFNMYVPGEDNLERVFDLPRTNGTEYQVIVYAKDNSPCGGLYQQETVGNWTGEILFDATTLDALPPVPSFDAERDEKAKKCLAASGWQYPVLRDGPIFIEFNEAVTLVDGDISSGADIAAAFLMEVRPGMGDPWEVWAISEASYYDAAHNTIVLIPENSFPSGYKLHVLMPINTVEDLAGNERNLAADHTFCVETYCEPLLSWTADKVDYPNSTDILEDEDLEYCDPEVAKDATLRVVFDMPVYVPLTNGTLAELGNNQSNAATWVGNFIKIRESAEGCTEAETGSLIYEAGNLVNFNITVNAYGDEDEPYTVITIEPDGFEFRSEYFYNIEVEGSLQSYSRYTINSGQCYDQDNHISFQVTDHTAPEIMFFEAVNNEYFDYIQELNECVDCDNPTEGVGLTNVIGVQISEWIELGFDGFRDLLPTDIIEDANALRRYFSLETCDGTPLAFDVVNFWLWQDPVLNPKGTAFMYLNPYFPDEASVDENDNFESNVSYTVKFLSNLYEIDYGPGAFADTHGNLVEEAEACFTGYVEPDPFSCAAIVTAGPPACDGITSDPEKLWFNFEFPYAMVTNDEVAPINGDQVTAGECTLTADNDKWFYYADFPDGPIFYTRSNDTDYGYLITCEEGCEGWLESDPAKTKYISGYGPIKGTFWYVLASDLEAVFEYECGGTPPPTPDPVLGQIKVWVNGAETPVCSIDVADVPMDLQNLNWEWFATTCDLEEGVDYVVTVTAHSWIQQSTGCLYPEYSEDYPEYPEGAETDDLVVFEFTTGDDTPPYIASPTLTPYSASFDKDNEDIVLVFSEPVIPIAGQVMEIFESGTNTKVATVNMTQVKMSADKMTMTIPNEVFSANLTYELTYYVQYNSGLVKDECENLLVDECLTKECFYFTVSEDPAPMFVCDEYAPMGEILDFEPMFVISFTEPVEPVEDKILSIFEQEEGSETCLIFGTCYVTEMEPNSDKTQWSIPYSEITKLSGNALEFGSCYHMNIAAGAFVEVNGTQTTPEVVSWECSTCNDETDCQWTFCVDDTKCPQVSFWPEDGDISIPVNAHLFVGFNEPVELSNGMELNTVTGQSYFSLTKGGNAVPFRVQQVAADKTWVMIVPEDPDAPQLQTTDNVHMEDDTEYVLSVVPTGVWGTLQDANENPVGGCDDDPWSVKFRTEDVTCPLYEDDVTLLTVSDETESGFKMTVKLPEIFGYGQVNYRVTKKGSGVNGTLVASGNIVFNKKSGKTVIKTITGIDANIAPALPGNGYDYEIWLNFIDDEKDLYDEDSEILAQWPYKEISGLELVRIRDLNPAPNDCGWQKEGEVTLCDDDAPLVSTPLQYQPLSGPWAAAVGVNTVPVWSSLQFKLNEAVAFTMPQADSYDNPAVAPYQIALRDYENNLLIPAIITMPDNKTVYIDPIDPLDDEHRYYITIDRYAIGDVSANQCEGANYLAERIDKSWWFKTMDNTKPVVICDDIIPNDDCTERGQDIVVTVSDGNSVTVNTALGTFLDIYEVSDDPTIPHERIPLSRHTKQFVGMEDGDSIWTFTFHTAYEYLSGECYYIDMPDNLFIDSFGNTSVYICENGYVNTTASNGGPHECETCRVEWCTEDYEAPVPEWVAKIDYSYMYTAYTDDQYVATWKTGIAGDVLSEVPTSSHFAVTFNEETQIWDAETEIWRDLSYAAWNPAILATALTITNEGEELEYGMGKDYWLQYIPGSENRAFRIIIANDYSHLGYGSWSWMIDWNNLPYLLGSMKSNSQYQITMNGGVVSDMPSCENEGNVMDETVLLTITTRDDTPPELTILDANGAVICDSDCPKAGSFYWNANQPTYDVDDKNWWMNWTPPMWPGQNSDGDDLDDCVNLCVAESDHIRLQFNKAVVKTPSEIINPPSWMEDPLWWLQPDVDWWTEANLPLKPADLADPSTSRFIKFQKWDDGEWVDAGVDFNVTVQDWSTFDLAWEGDLDSEGIYAITFAPIVVKDTIRIPDGNEFLGMTCTFKVVDHQAPTMEPDYLAEDACGQWNGESDYPMDLGTGTKLIMLFDEPVQAVPGKKLIIRRENGQQQQIIDASEVTISADGKTVNVNNGLFEENTLYYVEIQEGFVEDITICASNNPYAGIDPEDSEPGWQALIPTFEWVFKTGDNSAPIAIEEELFPAIGANDVSKNTDLVLTFTENVYTGCAPLAEGCDPHEGEIMHDYLGEGFYIYADNGANPEVDFGNFVEFIPYWVTVDDGEGEVTIQNPRIEISGTDIYNGMVSDVVTVNPATVFERNLTYYIRVSGNLFCDDFGNKWAGYRDYEWYFTITNDVAPVIDWASPVLFTAEGAPETVPAQPNGYAVTDLEMSFVDEVDHLPLNVAKGAGVLRIYEYIYNPLTFSYYEKLYKTIDINDESVVIEGNLVTVQNVTLLDDINPDNICLGPRMYYVTVEPGAITNGYPGSLTFWEGFNDAFDWRFYTAADDTFMVGHEIIKPVPGSENLSIEDASTLEITFAEDIEAWAGTEGQVKIFNVDGGALVDAITVMDEHISGNVLTLTTEALVDETKYFVTIDQTAFGDTSTCSTPFYGLLDTTEWTFHTGDNTPPVPVWAADLGDCEDPCVTLTFTFDETFGVSTGTGMINLWTADTIFASAAAVVGEDVNTITAEFCDLPDTTVFFISLDSAAVNDNGNNKLPNAMIADAAWTFKTADNTAPVVSAVGPAGDAEEADVTLEVLASEEVVAIAGKKVILTDGTTTWEFDATELVTEDGKTFTLPVADLEDTTTFNVTFEAGAFEDLSCEPNATEEATEWSFTTDDNTAPFVEETTPDAAEELDSYIDMTIDFTFSEDVAAGTGMVTVTRGDSVLHVDVTGDDVTIEGAVVTLHLDEMVYFGDVTVTVPEGAFVDLATNPNDNVAYEWTFSIVDEQFEPDCMTILEPEDGTEGVLSQPNLIIEFCERVSACATNKYVNVYELSSTSTNVPVAHILITSDMIQTGRTRVVIPLDETTILEGYNAERPGTLKDHQDYIVLADMGAICDENANPWEGLSDPTAWNFSTGDNTPPTGTLEADAELDNVVYATFSEEVVGAIDKIKVENAVSYTITTEDNIVFTIAINNDKADSVTITLPTSITDVVDAKGYGNPLAEEVVGKFEVVDNIAPTLVADPASGKFIDNVFEVTLTFDEEVTNVAESVSVSAGTVEVTGSGMVYTAVITGPSLTDVVLSVSNGVEDLAGNAFAGASFTYEVVGVVPIATIQGEANTSPFVGEVLQVEGTITGISPFEGFFVQDANAAWSGIWIAYTETEGLEIGDGVHVEGTVAEIVTVTTVNATSMTVIDAPLTVEPVVVASPAASKNEMYESVLVKVEGARANAANDIGLWTIYYQPINNIVVANWMYEYTPEEGHFYDVTGILNTRLEAFKLEPRMESDIVDLTPSKVDPSASLEFKVYPNPFNERIYIDNFDKLTRVVINNIAGQRVMDIESPEREIRTAHLVSGVYLISLMTEEGIVKTERIVKR